MIVYITVCIDDVESDADLNKVREVVEHCVQMRYPFNTVTTDLEAD